MKKGGQISIFIILGILIVGGVITIIITNGNVKESLTKFFSGKSGVSYKVDEVKKEIQRCLDISLEDSINVNAMSGGYFILTDNFIFYNSDFDDMQRKVPYYLDDGARTISVEELEKEMSSSMKDNFVSCFNPEKFDLNVSYDYGKMDIDTKFTKDKVLIEVKFPVGVSFGDDNFLLDNFEISQESNYFALYTFAKEITEFQNEQGNNLCLSCINDKAKKDGIKLKNQESYGVDENEWIIIYYLIKYNEITKKNEVFSFAHKFYRGENE